MSLSKEITLIIKDYSIKLSNPLKFYVNDSLYNYLYLPYKELGGNGTAERMLNEVKKLPIKRG